MRFSDIAGHTELKQQLAQLVAQNRIPHAQLFLGPEGSGNLALALAYVQLIFCANPSDGDSCGTCPSCSKIAQQAHPDLHFSFPTAGAKQLSTNYMQEWREQIAHTPFFNVNDWMSRIAKDENKSPNITREESRDILSKLSLKPFEGEAKALVIWMPEYLDKVGNALLKIIEEPPQKTYFILVAHQFDQLLPTLTSRTQLIKVPAYDIHEIVSYLKSKYQLEAQQAERLAFLSEGNLRLAEQFVEEVDDNHAELFREWMLACYANQLHKVDQITEQLAKQGRTQIQLFLQNGLKILRETLLYLSMDGYDIKFAGEYKEFIRRFSRTVNAELIERSYQGMNETIYHIGRNANAKISLFHLSLALRHNFIRKAG